MIVGSALECISRPNVLRPNVFAPKCPRAQMSAPKCRVSLFWHSLLDNQVHAMSFVVVNNVIYVNILCFFWRVFVSVLR